MSKIFELGARAGNLNDGVSKDLLRNMSAKLLQTEKGLAPVFSYAEGSYLNYNELYEKAIKKDVGTIEFAFALTDESVPLTDYVWSFSGVDEPSVGKFEFSVSKSTGEFKVNYLQTTPELLVWSLRYDNRVLEDGVIYHFVLVQDGIEPMLYLNGVRVIPDSVTELPAGAFGSWVGDAPGLNGFTIAGLYEGSATAVTTANIIVHKLSYDDEPLTASEVSSRYIEFARSGPLTTDKAIVSNTEGVIGFYDEPKFEKADGVNRTPEGYVAGTGSFQTKTDESGKQFYECTGAGTLSLPSTQAYGVWRLTFNKAASTAFFYYFINNPDTLDKYIIALYSSGQLRLLINVGGVTSTLFQSDSGLISSGKDYDLKVERSIAGLISVYIDDVIVPAVVGSNPITDNTHTISVDSVFSVGVSDKFKKIYNLKTTI